MLNSLRFESTDRLDDNEISRTNFIINSIKTSKALCSHHPCRNHNQVLSSVYWSISFAKSSSNHFHLKMEKVTDEAQFQVLTARDKLTVILFKANWAQTVCERTRTVLSDMSDYEDFQGISFVECEAEDVQEVCMKYDVAVVPAVLFFRKGRLLDRVDRYNAIELTNKVKHYAGNSEILYGAPEPIVEKNMQNGKAKAGEESEANVSDNGPYKGTPMEQRLQQLINQKEIMLFMKGNRDTPRCGFSNTMIQILNESTVPYGTFDILGDEEVRQALKIYSNWQTYPQLYVRGELIGGLDIVKELRENGELMETLLQPFPGGAATQEGV